jgi:hypothetical protein
LWIAGSVASTGGLAAIAIRKFGAMNAEDNRRGEGALKEGANAQQK